MYLARKGKVLASEVAEYLNRDLQGPDFWVERAATVDGPRENSMVFAAGPWPAALEGRSNILVLCSQPPQGASSLSHIVCPDPTLDFVTVVLEFFVGELERGIDPRAVVDPSAEIGRGVHIGPHAVVGPLVKIGKNTVVMSHAVINGEVEIGADCVIKSNAVIGSEGYWFVKDAKGRPIHVPQLGTIRIGNQVWVGSNSTIERSDFRATVIEHNVKIDDLVHVGGGCHLTEGCMITAGTVLGRNVVVGAGSWLAPNVSVREQVRIGANVLVGLGSVVLRDLADGGVFAGAPARFLRPNHDNLLA
jgi:UDP-3-O-[3-hydroxymyristoyl] glucosamine N-acyltransferase